MNIFEDLKWRGLIQDISSPELENKLNNEVDNVEPTSKETLENKEPASNEINNDEKKIFIEEYYEGEEYNLVMLWDGKNSLYFPIHEDLTEVQAERLDFLQTKLNFMFSDEKADFIGFVVAKLLWTKNDWYILEFQSHLDEDDIKTAFSNLSMDFLYILNSAIYQKLNEISF